MNSGLMKHQYAHTIPTGRDRMLLAITSPCLHVAIQDRPARAERGGDECCGRNLHRTGCRPLHDHAPGREGAEDSIWGGGSERERFARGQRPKERKVSRNASPISHCPPLSSDVRGASGASCTLRILHTKRMRTLNRRPSTPRDIIRRDPGTEAGDVCSRQQAVAALGHRRDCLLSAAT